MAEPHRISELYRVLMVEYRCLVLQNSDLDDSWRDLDWVHDAPCGGFLRAAPEMCSGCPVVHQCLAAALVTDDHADWRGGMSRAQRFALWLELEELALRLEPWLIRYLEVTHRV